MTSARGGFTPRAMKIRDADILIVPGYGNSSAGHWQSRWQAKMANARRVEQAQWNKPDRTDWIAQLRTQIVAANRPVVLVAHALGVATAVHAITGSDGDPAGRRVAGAFLVSPPDLANDNIEPKHLTAFGPYPAEPLPCPAFVLASRNDPSCTYQKADEMAADWGALLVDAGHSGHLDEKSGHGPWPEGMMLFARFMNRL